VPSRRFHLQVDVGLPVSAASFRREGEASSRAARRLTEWMLEHFDAGRLAAPAEPWMTESGAPDRPDLMSSGSPLRG
jgi:hypothetical protein